MGSEEKIARLKEIIKPYTRNTEALEGLTAETDFINDLKVNSANLVDIILDVEEAFNITIDNQSMEKMLNVQAAMDIIDTKLAEK